MMSLSRNSIGLIAALLVCAVFMACGSETSGLDTMNDTDNDGLLDSRELEIGTDPGDPDTDGDLLKDGWELDSLGTDPSNPDSDGDGVWDGEELDMFDTSPNNADSDGDGMSDRADPEPLRSNATIPAEIYAVFTNNASGTDSKQLTETRFQENHVVFAPPSAPQAPFFIYQTHLRDVNNDGKYDEGDLAGTAIAAMNLDGSRPRLLTDVGADGKRLDNGAVDATPEPSPDGSHIIFGSDRHNPGSFQIRLYVMGIDGSNPVQVQYESDAPGEDELDADPFWGPDNKVTFKREKRTSGAKFSRIYTATMNPGTMTLTNVTLRTEGEEGVLNVIGPGDYDPKVSPDGQLIASYRHLSSSPGIFGDWDVWIGRYSDPAQPGEESVQFIDVDQNTANLFPRWDRSGKRLAVWSINAAGSGDIVDIIVYRLSFNQSPFIVTLEQKRNITAGQGWAESMPSWNTDPLKPDMLVYSATR